MNRGPSGEIQPWPGLPSIRRLFVRELDPRTYWDALGIGMADAAIRLVRHIFDWTLTRVNALQLAGTPSAYCVPAPSPNRFRECLQWIGPTAGKDPCGR